MIKLKRTHAEQELNGTGSARPVLKLYFEGCPLFFLQKTGRGFQKHYKPGNESLTAAALVFEIFEINAQ